MEDRYLCRAQTFKENWIQGYLIPWRPEHDEFMIGTRRGEKQIPIVPHTVCQCTGKKDRNGKLVFDRDVIQVHLNGEEKVTYFSIGWNGSGWSTYLGTNRYGTFDRSVADNCEVRGTLFDREGQDLVFKQETERS